MRYAAPSARAFAWHAWRRAAGNFALFEHRHCDGHMLSQHQSGTHWLKFMLANALAMHHGTPAPRYNHANDIIGGPKDLPRYPALPHLISSHSIAHPLLNQRWIHRTCRLPRYVVLVRDIRATLVSNYMKWRDVYGVDFSTYVCGDPRGRRYNSDLWWTLRFLNAWGEVASRVSERVTVVHYEKLVADPQGELGRVAHGFALALPDSALAHGVAVSSKAAMEARDDPARPPGAVRLAHSGAPPSFAPADREFLTAQCARHLRHAFGYDYQRW